MFTVGVMVMASANEIREVILSFAQHRDNNRFVLEFSTVSFDIRRHGSPEAIQLADAVQSRLADVTVGHGRKQDLCAAVSMLAGNVAQEAEPVVVPNDFAPALGVLTGTSTSLSLGAAAGAVVGGLVGATRALEFA
jgi:hypothetical protein